MKKNNNTNSKKAGPIQFNDSDELLDIRYDNIFKAVFTKDTPNSRGALSGLISALIKRKVTVQTIIANEPPAESVFNRNIRFDIACKAKTGEFINIEMTFYPESYELERLEYFASRQFSGQNIKGIDKDYSDLKETYQIAILGKERFFSDEVLVHTFHYFDSVNSVSLPGKIRIITLELLKAESIVSKPINKMGIQEAWSVFFQYLTDCDKREIINEILQKEAEIKMASETLIEISRDEIERARLTSELKYILDNQSMRVSAKREGEKIGFKKGEKKGKKEIIDMLISGKPPQEIIKEYKAGNSK